MFIVAVVTITSLLKWSRYPKTAERIMKMYYIHNGVYLSIKKNEIMLFAGK
jgi:hypothetical protein